MKLREVRAMLMETGFPVSFGANGGTEDYPQLLVFESAHKHRYADNSNYSEMTRFSAELYTRAKQPEAEAAVEAALAGRSLTWKKGPDDPFPELGWVRIVYEFWGA